MSFENSTGRRPVRNQCDAISSGTGNLRAIAPDLVLDTHPFSSYCQKVLIALYENDTPFDWRLLSGGQPACAAGMVSAVAI